MTLVDTSVWVDFFRGADNPEVARLDQLLQTELVVIGDIVLAEVLQGFDQDRHFHQALGLLRELEVVQIGGLEVAIAAAQNFRALRAAGVTVRKTIDTLIATRCILDGRPLLHRDRDFAPFVRHLGLRDAMSDGLQA